MNIEFYNSQVQYNVALAFELGMDVPETLFLGNLEDKDEIFFSPEWDILSHNFALRHIEGIEITASAFWNGESFSYFTLSSRDNYLLSGAQGIKLSDNILTCWSGKLNITKKIFKRIEEKLLNEEFIGFVHFDIVLDEDRAYYQKITFGSTVDFITCLSELHDKHMDVLTRDEDKRPRGFASSLRLFVYPYDPDTNILYIDSCVREKRFNQSPIIVQKGDESYILCRKGSTIKDSWREIYKDTKGLALHGICFRTDGGRKARRIFNEIKRRQYA